MGRLQGGCGHRRVGGFRIRVARGARRRGVVFDEHRRRRAKEARHRRTCVRGSDDRDRDCASRDASARVCSRVDRAPALLRGGFPRLGKNRVVKHRASRRLGRRRHRLARNRGQNVGGEDPRTGQYLQSELQRRGRGAHRAVLRVAARKLTRHEKTLLKKKKKSPRARFGRNDRPALSQARPDERDLDVSPGRRATDAAADAVGDATDASFRKDTKIPRGRKRRA